MTHRSRQILIAIQALALAAAAHADPVAELMAFASFKEVNLEKLATGTVIAARGPATNFPRGLAIETAYVVRRPLQKTADFHVQWSPNRHPELKVYLHSDLPAHPTAADFQKIASAPGNSAVKSLVAATQKLAAGAGDLQLSAAEAKSFAGGSDAGRGAMPAGVASFWSNVLLQRSQAYLSGGIGALPPYASGKDSVRAADDVVRLLKDAPKIRGQFAALLDATPLGGGKGSLTPAPYWEMFDVEGQAAFSLGAVYSKARGDGWQIAEAQYYASGGYYALLTLYQMWPVKIGNQDCTLIWRGDLISSPSLAALHGVERMGSSTAMMRETQKVIEYLLRDVNKAP